MFLSLKEGKDFVQDTGDALGIPMHGDQMSVFDDGSEF
jgi:hypothetical protein